MVFSVHLCRTAPFNSKGRLNVGDRDTSFAIRMEDFSSFCYVTRWIAKRTRVVCIQALVVCLLLMTGSWDAEAQTASTGALTGTVIDPTGGVLRSTRITLRNKDTAETRITITGQEGAYRFSLLAPGAYELTFEAVGFAPL